jgi:crotonobetainyl-CoA:carnitine CoA-transferase CaiB-like acyl-CoA transferase
VFQAAVGGSVLLSIQNEREWQRFCAEILDQADLAEDARFATNSDRVRHRETLDAIVRGAFLRLPAEALLDRLRGAGIACGRVSSLDDLARHPQLRLTQADTPGGRVELLAPGALMDGESPSFGPVPALGADSARVRAEFAANGAKTEG